MVEGFDSFEKFEQYCIMHASRIMVRAFVNNKWQSVSLYSLPGEDQKGRIEDWWHQGVRPHRVH